MKKYVKASAQKKHPYWYVFFGFATQEPNSFGLKDPRNPLLTLTTGWLKDAAEESARIASPCDVQGGLMQILD